ncbi:sulfatase-like hydrolase/transferase [Haloferula chungangensis]|uniref:Sulfatase-like hydrolase/transferase n=1 Tax=Haloferula chungangensis TaxID=1048331 RepID=A0ABW2L377_9BACT
MKQTLLSLSAALCCNCALHATPISYNGDYNEGAVLGVDLDLADDWWMNGPDELTDTFAEKIDSTIALTAQGGGSALAQNRTAHTYTWSDGTGTVNNPSAPTAHDPDDYRRREYSIGLLGGAPTLDLTKGAYYSVDTTVGSTEIRHMTVYGMARRNDEIYCEAILQDGTKTTTRASLSPVLLGTQANDSSPVSFSFSLEVQAEAEDDILSFTIASYSAAASTDRSLAIDAVTVGPPPLPPEPKVPNTTIPNVIIIFTDDHGYTDLGIHGVDTNVQTPAMDLLAAGGALMRHGYCTAPQCVPSRAGLMSGRIQNTFGTRQNGPIWGANPMPLDIPTIAERISALGTYQTGMIGKWHLEPHNEAVEGTDFPGTRSAYNPENRGFQEHWRNSISPYVANFDLAGNTVDPVQSIADSRNRVIVQGEAAEAFIERNCDQPFFLYLSLYGPHLPRMSTNDPYYTNFPVLNYPHYSAEMNDIRRLGLGLVLAIDDAVAGVMQKLRELGIEENTLILFSGDNGAQPKFFNGMPGSGTLGAWTGNENLPLRGEKGSLWEGGIKVPMFAYWKGTIPPGQVIDEPVWTLDFTATALKLAGGTIPPEFDGVDILPRLKGDEALLTRPQPMFWDWGSEIAIRDGEWKYYRNGSLEALFNLARDPMELYDVKADHPTKFAALKAEMMAWYNALPAEGQSPLNGDGIDFYVTGNPSTETDARYVLPFTDGAPAAYPAPLQYGTPTYNGDGDPFTDWEELLAGSDPGNPSDFFQIESGALLSDGSYAVEFRTLIGRRYTLWHSDDLKDWDPVDTTGTVSTAEPASLIHPNSSSPSFYRLEVTD